MPPMPVPTVCAAKWCNVKWTCAYSTLPHHHGQGIEGLEIQETQGAPVRHYEVEEWNEEERSLAEKDGKDTEFVNKMMMKRYASKWRVVPPAGQPISNEKTLAEACDGINKNDIHQSENCRLESINPP